MTGRTSARNVSQYKEQTIIKRVINSRTDEAYKVPQKKKAKILSAECTIDNPGSSGQIGLAVQRAGSSTWENIGEYSVTDNADVVIRSSKYSGNGFILNAGDRLAHAPRTGRGYNATVDHIVTYVEFDS